MQPWGVSSLCPVGRGPRTRRPRLGTGNLESRAREVAEGLRFTPKRPATIPHPRACAPSPSRLPARPEGAGIWNVWNRSYNSPEASPLQPALRPEGAGKGAGPSLPQRRGWYSRAGGNPGVWPGRDLTGSGVNPGRGRPGRPTALPSVPGSGPTASLRPEGTAGLGCAPRPGREAALGGGARASWASRRWACLSRRCFPAREAAVEKADTPGDGPVTPAWPAGYCPLHAATPLPAGPALAGSLLHTPPEPFLGLFFLRNRKLGCGPHVPQVKAPPSAEHGGGLDPWECATLPNPCSSRRSAPDRSQRVDGGRRGEGNRRSGAWPPRLCSPCGCSPTSGSLSLSLPPPRRQPQACGAGVLVLSFLPCHQACP